MKLRGRALKIILCIFYNLCIQYFFSYISLRIYFVMKFENWNNAINVPKRETLNICLKLCLILFYLIHSRQYIFHFLGCLKCFTDAPAVYFHWFSGSPFCLIYILLVFINYL